MSAKYGRTGRGLGWRAGPGYGVKFKRRTNNFTAWFKNDIRQQCTVGTFSTHTEATEAAVAGWEEYWRPRLLANKWLTSPRIQA